MIQLKTLCDCILDMKKRDPERVAIKYKKNETWIQKSWQDYFILIESLGLGLLELGLKKEDRVAIFSNTRWEWCVCDYGIIGCGAITVPIYQTVTPDELEYILNDSQARFLIIENKTLLKIFNSIKDRCPLIEKVIFLENPTEGALSFDQLCQKGKIRKSRTGEEFSDLCRQSQSDQTITLIYTSGTTGLPKGVVLTHTQAISEVSEAFPYVGANQDDVALTFLPYAHILGRIEHWGQTYMGYTLAFAESIDKVKNNLLEIQPTIMVAVPRIFEKIYASIWSQVDSNPVTRKVFRWALSIGLKVTDHKLKHESIPLSLMTQLQLAKKAGLEKVKQAFGGKLRFAISGGAPMSRDIALFFHACDILILEGYGLTETTAAITVNTPFDYHFGSVGKPIGDVKIKIAEDGEILIQSKKVMIEYYKNPDSTKESFTENWFHTGDIGVVLPNGDLKITDRKKDLIKTAGGKYVAPQKLENLLKVHNFISHVLIHGDQKKYIVALLTLDKNFVINFAKENNVSYSDYASLTQDHRVLEMVRKSIAETNRHLASYETIKRFTILPNEFTIESGELTPSLKVKRKVLDKKYKKEIEALYQ